MSSSRSHRGQGRQSSPCSPPGSSCPEPGLDGGGGGIDLAGWYVMPGLVKLFYPTVTNIIRNLQSDIEDLGSCKWPEHLANRRAARCKHPKLYPRCDECRRYSGLGILVTSVCPRCLCISGPWPHLGSFFLGGTPKAPALGLQGLTMVSCGSVPMRFRRR
jgi:hypothetical protein